ncbi:MAG: hypothetical protein ACLU5H_06965 [Alphaproteobacteria bacterium]|jgi:hypothetical protein|uniref:hypothetical protein n=1 Tax=Candidatus Scatocola faecigallinarum TaxID=2840916 RepID=UPI001FA58253|nr:hypothetical protein [Alphaproteobacteria bacterium]HIV08385.1 hypothetical protein [Candidatus Scatocola faecigallinarum]
MNLIKYTSQSQQKQHALRRTLGVQLFACRQKLRQSLKHVQEKTGVPIRIIDRLEIGKGDVRWGYVLLLLNYYERTINFARLLKGESGLDRKKDAEKSLDIKSQA